MKRSAWIQILTLILSLVMLISLFACDNNKQEAGSKTESDSQTETGGESNTEGGESNTEGGSGIIGEFEAVDKSLYLAAQSLNVFAAPSLDSEKIDTLVYGEKVSVVAVNTYSGWYKIALEDGNFGYVPSSSVYFSESDPAESESESDSESDSESGGETSCEHPYAAIEAGHYKPACDVCGKPEGKVQDHQYEEKVEDGGDVWLYSFVCKVCGYAAYVQEVDYDINYFFAPGEIAASDTNSTFAGGFLFDMGTGFAAFTKGGGGSGNVKLVDTQEASGDSGRYLVMKVRLPSSQSGFTVSVKSLAASGNYSMSFSDLKPGWVTVIADMNTATSGTTGYLPNGDGEHNLSYLSVNGRVTGEEHFDIAYVMICDSLEQAQSFTKNEKQLYTYTDVNAKPDFVKAPCVDKDGNEITHTIIGDENGHSVTEPCYQCGLTQVENEPHTYTQMKVNGELTYACSVCEYLQYGYYLNKYFSAEEIFNNGLVYYRTDKTLQSEGEHSFPRFTGRGAVAQIIFARNNWATANAPDQVAAAFSVGKAGLLVVRMRTNSPDTKFFMMLGGAPRQEKELVFPTRFATVVSEEGAENTEYGWTTYVLDLPKAIPSVFVPDENGEYKLHNFYFQIGTGESGTDYTSDVYYDIDYMAFVDNWDELRQLVGDETVVKVNATNDGTIVKTQEQECVGEHSWGEEVDSNKYTYLCANCGKILKSVTLDSSVQRYFSGFEIARNATVYALSGSREVLIDENNTVFGRVNSCAEIWWMRDQKDYSGGTTGGSLDGKTIDVGEAKYFVVRLKTDNSKKNFEFYISTTGKNGTPRTEEEVTDKKPIQVPVTSGIVTLTSPVQASTAGEWTTYVFDLEALLPEHYVKDAETGHYILDTFAITYSMEYNADVEFMAFVEGGWAEIDALTPDQTVVFATHHKNKTYSIMETATGKCANDQHSYLYGSEEQADGSTLYSYACGGCGDLVYSKSISDSVTKFISGNEVATGAALYALKGTNETGVDDGVFYGRVADHAEIWWMRHQQDYKAGTGGQLDNKFMDVGEAKYFVVKLRVSDATKYVEFYLSTTGKNGEGYSVGADGTVTRPTTNGYASFSALISTVAEADEWITLVFDLETIFSDYYVKDPAQGKYIIDTFAITYAQGNNLDVEYMAFVEGDWSDIDALVDEETVINVTHSKNKTYETVYTATGLPVQ